MEESIAKKTSFANKNSLAKKPSFFSTHKTETIVIGVVISVVVVVGVLVLLWYLNVIMPRYRCVSGLCVKNKPGKPDPPGSYSSSDCNNECATKPPPTHFKCDSGVCVPAENGDYKDSTCDNNCTIPPARGTFKCDADSGCVAASDGNYEDSTCEKKCTRFSIQDTEGAPATCQKQTQATSASRKVRANVRANTATFYSKDQCTAALTALPYQKCQFDTTKHLNECMKTPNASDYPDIKTCQSGCKSFECTGDGCTECATTGCTKAEHYLDTTCNKSCGSKYQFVEATGAAPTCEAVTVPVKTTTANLRNRLSRLDSFYNRDQCTQALNALPYQKCDFNTSSGLYQCMKTSSDAHFQNQGDCDAACKSFECTDNGCMECAQSGCTSSDHHYSSNTCGDQCKKFQFVNNDGQPAECAPVAMTTAAVNTRGRLSRIDPFYSKSQCTTALNALTSKKCIKKTDGLTCVTTFKTKDLCGNIDGCYKCDSSNCKSFTLEHGIASAVQFTFPGLFFPDSGSYGNKGNTGAVKTHVLLFMAQYTAQTDGGVLELQPAFELVKSENNGKAVATWLVFTDDYCKTQPDVFPSKQYFSGSGSNPNDINDGQWITKHAKDTGDSDNVFNFINGAGINSDRWGFLPGNFGDFSAWDDYGILHFYTLPLLALQTITISPTKKDKKYNICLYIGSNTSDKLTVNNQIQNSWGSLTEATWYDTDKIINQASYFEFPGDFFWASSDHGNGNWDIWSHTLLWMGSYTATTEGGTLTVHPQFQLLKPDLNNNGQAAVTWLVFTDEYCQSHTDAFPSAPYLADQGHNAVDINNKKWFTDPKTQASTKGPVYNFIKNANDNTTATTLKRWGNLPDLGNFGNWPADLKFTMIPNLNITQDIQVYPTKAGKRYNICMYLGTNTTDKLRISNTLPNSWGLIQEI